ncbi:MAG: TAXI family TRAP transporter solute-binding subunit [Alphaproteobacteria bacterium]
MGTRSFVLVMIALLGLALAGLWYWQTSREYTLLVAAGQKSSQAFQVADALRKVITRHYPEIKIEVFETRGSLHNAKLLDEGAVQLATLQADQATGSSARLLAELYPDTFQIVVRGDSGIHTISDLIGKRIALPPEQSGDYEAFWFLANYYSLTNESLRAFTGTERTTDWLLMNGDVDALFRIRAPGDRSILRLIQKVNGRVVPIPQAAALQLRHPALEAGSIPIGSYKGRPAIPGSNEETISVKQLLLAREQVPPDVVAKVASVLFEHRRELMEVVPIAGQITTPDASGQTLVPIHAGVRAFWDRDKPSFIQENAEPIALLITIAVVTASAYLQLANRRRKKVMDAYNRELIALGRRARNAPDFGTLDECNNALAEFVGRIVHETERGRINTAEFTLFNFAYDAVEDAVKDRSAQLERQERKEVGTAFARMTTKQATED